MEVLFTPADFAALSQRDLSDTCCVVFDVLRATSTMTCALWNGAAAILPVEEIEEALAARGRFPGALLAGEREGVRIGPDLTGGITFDLGNSPREFTTELVQGRTIVMTTTNGTRALRACLKARMTFAASFLNLSVTCEAINQSNPAKLLLICSGTRDQAAYEDVLGAGALCDLLWSRREGNLMADSAQMARELFLRARKDLYSVVSLSRNARRLLALPQLREDVSFCLQRDRFPLVARVGEDGLIRQPGAKLDA